MQNEVIQGLRFNQSGSFLCASLSDGFAVFQCAPFQQAFRRKLEGSVVQAEMLFQCQILAIVGGGPAALAPPNLVLIWDDAERRAPYQVEVRTPVKAVRMRKELLAVATAHRVTLYRLEDMGLAREIETLENPHGILAMSPVGDSCVIACPGLHRGQVRLETMHASGSMSTSGRGDGRTRFVDAHKSGLRAVEVSLDGSRLATASERGTLVRVFSVASGECLVELRRGAEPAMIYSLAFSKTGSWLAVASSTQTVHLFSLDTASSISMVRPGVAPGVHEGGGGGVMRHVREAGGAVIGMLRPMLPHYMRGQGRSAASFQVPDSGPCVVAFDSSLGVGEAERVQVATAGGTFLRFRVGGPQGAVLESHCALGL